MSLQAFTTSQPLTLGVELELQLVSTHDFDLAPQAEDLLRVLKNHTGTWDVKPEITRSMIEIGTSIQRQHAVLLAELQDLRDQLSRGARKLNIGIAGGGTHPLPALEPAEDLPGRTLPLHQRAVRLPGQAVHRVRPACARGLRGRRPRAVAAACTVSRYIPHFIALSASSPFVQGQDTGFDSARLNSVFAFPLSGRAPFVPGWDEFGSTSTR
jgi:carboxylate-amine ligase